MSIDAVIPAQILLVEDSPGDIRLTREALRDAKIANELQVVGDGEAALDFLHQRGPYADMPRPDIVLLDLNLPRKDGREVLQEMKADEELRRIPVIVLTTSVAEGDVLRSYDLHVNAFVTKPLDLAGFVQVVRSIESFWLSIVRLPTA
jgi:two-component system, chemotaxis family, response regulator Rcp1